MCGAVFKYVQTNLNELYQWSKCGDSPLSVIPTVCWALGSVMLSQRILSCLFRRFLFRRVPLWEVILHKLLFLWMVIYSLQFWMLLIKVINILTDYCFEEAQIMPLTQEDLEGRKTLSQLFIWCCGIIPIALYVQIRPRNHAPQLMIWIATNPWNRREMGAYGYYLNRPPAGLHSQTNLSLTGDRKKEPDVLRNAYSDSQLLLKQPTKKKRHSKSV